MYMGQTLVRGIACDWWRSCMYWERLASNFTLDYYFTGENFFLTYLHYKPYLYNNNWII